MTVRPLTAGDLRLVVELWNARLSFDPVTPDRLASMSLGEPTVEPDGAVVAEEAGKILAFGVIGMRAAPVGGDSEADVAHLKAVLHAEGRDDALDAILARLTTVAKRRSRKRFIIRGGGGGRYISPGIDLRYGGIIESLTKRGFTELEILQDADVDLNEWTPNERQTGIGAKLHAAGIAAIPYTVSLLPAMREFVPNCGEPDWFPVGWEEAWARAGRAIVAVDHGRILSYAEYTPDPVRGWFGPTATLPDRRDSGIGTLVLTRTMQALQEAGTPFATASWVYPPEFYLKSGWRISRRYAAMEKRL